MADAKYIIVGGGVAAARACEGIRSVDSSGSILVITQEGYLPYQRPPLSKGYLAGRQGLDRVVLHDEAYYEGQGIRVMTRVAAERISRRGRKVTLSNGESLEYEELLLATGGRAWRLPLSGADLPGVFTLRTIADSDAIRAEASEGRRAVVIGGSFIGCEVAATLAQRGVHVTMCFLEQYPLQALATPELGERITALFDAHGARIVPATRPERIEGQERVEAVRLESGETVPCDLVIMGVGIRLNTQLARDADLDLTDFSAIVVDETLRTSDPHIWAAGDIAAWPDPHYGRRLRVEHWDVAHAQGYQVGCNMAGANEPYTRAPYFFSDIFDLSFEVWGDLEDWDRSVARGSLEDDSVSYWYFAQDTLVGVLALGRPDEERDAMEQLVTRGLAYDEVAEALQDEGRSLDDLLA
jgi:3-phenylpropionate/trans-cinnamate dioxygenase ferredoxin reductase component